MPDINSVNTGESGALANALPARAMRVGMENKGLLTAKGTSYVGTGATQTVTITTESGDTVEYNIPITTSTPAPPANASSSNPYVLVYTGGEANGGMEWRALSSLSGT